MTTETIHSTVLIVDDQQFARDLARRTLTNLGYVSVLDAGDGEAALDIVRQAKPEIIVCDINMQPMSGFQFLSELRAMPAPLRDLPVILLTAHTDEAFVRKARELKVARYLLKSEMISRLDMAIRQVLSARVED